MIIKMMKRIGWLFLLIAIGYGCQESAESPTVAINLEELTISQIHEAYKAGEYTSEQLVTAYLERINQLDRSTGLNAIVINNEAAIQRARELDAEYRETGSLGALHGIPVIVKDNYQTIGLPTTAGSIALKDFMAEEDAFQVRRLKEAGAIVLAKSNMAEWAFSPMHTNSSILGTTRNPYHLDYVPAGSSGGTGAAVAANFGAVGLGTDTGNSIRGPSSHNALVGFRSTLGLTSRHGIVPLYLRNDVGGPMCRTVEDATRILQVIAGYDEKDPITENSRGQIPDDYVQFLRADGLQGARIGVLRVLANDDIHPEIASVFEQAIADLSRLGAQIVDPFEVPGFDSLRQNQWCSMFKQDIEEYLRVNVKDENLSTLQDLIDAGEATPIAKARMAYFLENEGRRGENPQPCEDAYTDQHRIAFREAIEKAMDSLQVDAIIYPSWNHPPATIDNFQEEYKGDNSQIIAPHTGQPAFTVPMGYTNGNLPAGLQFLGRMYAEPTLIRITYAYEQGTKHRRPPVLTAEEL